MINIKYCPIMGAKVHFYQMPKLSKAQEKAYKKRQIIKSKWRQQKSLQNLHKEQ